MSKKLVKSTGVVAGMTMVSRILGFVRDVALAGFFGAGPAFDAFVIAFKIPNFFRRLFAEGAFSQAFVPILTEYKTQQSQADVSVFVGKVAGALLASLLVIVVLAEIGVPLLVVIFAPGFLHHPVRYELSKHLLYITFSLPTFNFYGRFCWSRSECLAAFCNSCIVTSLIECCNDCSRNVWR